MRHLSDESLARLVDDQPTPDEAEHLHGCEECARTLEELASQTDALSALPEIRPPLGEWAELERRLVEEGLITGADDLAPARSPAAARSTAVLPFRTGWLQTAAALILFLGGTGFGAWVAYAGAAGPEFPVSGVGPEASAPVESGEIASVEEAALYVQSAEEAYVDALLTYRELLDVSDGGRASDPATRVAALEALVAASQAAIQEAPADPFFNGVLASAMAERQAAIRQISFASNDTWY